MLKFLLIGDRHNSENTPSSRIDDFALTCEQKDIEIMHIAKSHNVNAILHPGDFFTDSDKKLGNEFMGKIVNRWRSCGIPLIGIAGNHDLIGNNIDSLPSTTAGLLDSILGSINLFRIIKNEEVISFTDVNADDWFYNDVLYVDHTFGFTTALGVICNAIDRVRTTAYSHDRVQILEVMGRNCGWLALEGGLSGGADIILLPEIPYDIYKIVDVIKKRDEAGHFDTVIVVSEGAKPKDGNVVIKKIVADSADTIRLGGIGDQLASQLEVLLGGKEVRATNIGHTQRGGETCQFDRSLCTKFGSLAVDALFEGKSGEMVTIYNSVPQTVSLEKVLGSGATGETSKGGKNSVDPNGFVIKTARNIGISFGD